MLDIQYIREHPDIVKEAIANRNMGLEVGVVDEVLELDVKRKELLKVVEEKRARQNEVTAEIAKSRTDALIAEAKELKQSLKPLEAALQEVEVAYDAAMKVLPNLVHPDVPVGKDEDENIVLRTWGEKPSFDFEPRDHVDLGIITDTIDVETSSEISGARFNYLKGDVVMLQFALLQFALRTLQDQTVLAKLGKSVGNTFDRPFTPVIPPVMVRPSVMKQMDRLDPIDERFQLKDDDLILVGSAEHSLGPMFINKTMQIEELPIRLVGYSTSFRREAGSYGKDTRGILRVHQFDKLEMMSFSTVEQGEAEQDLIVAIQEYLMQRLELPYEVIGICTGDMGRPDYRQIDINCYMPGQGTYRETNTSDYNTDFQARRMNTKYVDAQGEKHYVHMNDATAFAMGRMLIAIVENYQREDGSIIVPTVLRDFVGKEKIEPKNG